MEHHNGNHDQPPVFLQELQDLTVLDGDEVTLSVKLTGELVRSPVIDRKGWGQD